MILRVFRYAGEEAETEAESGSVIDGHYVAVEGPEEGAKSGADAADVASSSSKETTLGHSRRSLFSADDSRGGQRSGRLAKGGGGSMGGRGMAVETGTIGSHRSDARAELRDRAGSSAGMTGLNEILDVNNVESRRGSGVRLRTNVLKT